MHDTSKRLCIICGIVSFHEADDKEVWLISYFISINNALFHETNLFGVGVFSG